MRIEGIGNLPGLSGASPLSDIGGANGANRAGSAGTAGSAGGAGFGDEIARALDQVNTLQGNADVLAQKLASGDVEDIHQVMLALDKASTAFGLTVQVRNKVLEAYQEVMRMQV